jgi:hypothetical protein
MVLLCSQVHNKIDLSSLHIDSLTHTRIYYTLLTEKLKSVYIIQSAT